MPDSRVQEFQSKWGKYFNYSRQELLYRRDELRWLWQVEAGDDLKFTVRTKRLREQMWRELRRPAEFTWICNHWLRLERQSFHVVATKQGLAGLSANDRCLPAILSIA